MADPRRDDPLLDPPPIPWAAVIFLVGMGALAGASIGYMAAGSGGALALGVLGAAGVGGYVLARLLAPRWRARRIRRAHRRRQAHPSRSEVGHGGRP